MHSLLAARTFGRQLWVDDGRHLNRANNIPIPPKLKDSVFEHLVRGVWLPEKNKRHPIGASEFFVIDNTRLGDQAETTIPLKIPAREFEIGVNWLCLASV
jgi:hypothetical protein